jgi:membrane protein implicated in regulation of membrane protease activity
MIIDLIRQLGIWGWLIFGIVLLLAEILVPGNFLVWVGVAGIVTGGLSLLFWQSSWWVWEIQWIVFAALSVVSVFAGRRWLIRSGTTSDEPTLNQRGASLVGRTANLIDPIVNGHGRVKIGDTVWLVDGPDLPLGAKVRVTGSHGSGLKVEAQP